MTQDCIFVLIPFTMNNSEHTNRVRTKHDYLLDFFRPKLQLKKSITISCKLMYTQNRYTSIKIKVNSHNDIVQTPIQYSVENDVLTD